MVVQIDCNSLDPRAFVSEPDCESRQVGRGLYLLEQSDPNNYFWTSRNALASLLILVDDFIAADFAGVGYVYADVGRAFGADSVGRGAEIVVLEGGIAEAPAEGA